MHQHLSLWDATGRRMSSPGDGAARPGSPASDLFRWFLGGWIAHAAELTALCGAVGQLLQAFPERLLRADGHRLEPRQPHGGLPGGRRGSMRCGSSAASRAPTRTRISPMPRRSPRDWTASRAASSRRRSSGGRLRGQGAPRVPRSLRDATAGSSRAPLRARHSARTFVNHYVHFLRTEQRKFDEAVTDWERARFFERGEEIVNCEANCEFRVKT